MTVLNLFFAVALFELAVVGLVEGKKSRFLAGNLLIIVLAFTQGLVLLDGLNFATLSLSLATTFRIINLMRFGYGRMNADYLKKSVFRTSWRLMLIQLFTYNVVIVVGDNQELISVVSVALLIFSALVFFNTAKRLSKIDLPSIVRPQATRGLPVVSVAIPARNETEDLKDCLQSVLESDYPKLEILVYDDCSQDRTPEIIKNYAQKGVRFIAGSPPEKNWLAKNTAYQKLTEEALGDYILFCGVDLRFEPTAISSLVAIMQNRKLDMVNILPRRGSEMKWALFYQSARYLWELALPRQLAHRQPALSSCWIAKKSLLGKSAFKAVSRSIMPERYFAWKADKRSAYSFISSRNLPLVSSQKTISEQRVTAMRLRYPQLRKRPENVLVYLLAAGIIVVLPAALLVLSVTGNIGFEYLFLGLATIILLNLTNGLITNVVSPKHALLASLIFPAVVAV
ncbi:MAG: glycosyltransferase family 2 protein, partial [bacterium]|nr:glycosyltransferase family 2 protein [bacterium]